MSIALSQQPDSCQARFQHRWSQVTNPHVRALAWLLQSPDLLDVNAPQWQGKIATLSAGRGTAQDDWLTSLDQDPSDLEAALNNQPTNRLGRYAEQLLTFYFEHQGMLVSRGVQVQDGKNGTIGEFDFLLHERDALVHWELATKFFLFESNYFVGPSLADTLGQKMHKILDQQLVLAHHPAAQIHLPQSVSKAAALIKGWLFYQEPHQAQHAIEHSGLSTQHCRGFWCSLSDWQSASIEYAMILPRLQWLAPASIPFDQSKDGASIGESIREHQAHHDRPQLVAVLERQGDYAVEISRGFVVKDDWRDRAREYLRCVDK